MNFLKPIFLFTALTLINASYANDEQLIEQLLVTSTRGAELKDPSLNQLNTVSKEQIELTKAEHIQQILSQVPGVNWQRGDGQESLPGIRSAVLTGAGACGNVLILEEGIPVRGPALCNVNELFDTHFEGAAQVEVIRGPGTSLYGSNSINGTINIGLSSDVEDQVSLEFGENDYLRGQLQFGYSNQENNSKGGFYLTLTDTDSFREDSGYNQQKFSWRDSRKFDLWTFDSGLTATRLDQQTAGFIVGLDSYLDRSLAQQNLDPEAFRNTESFRVWSRATKQLSDQSQFQFTPYIRATDMDFRLHFLPGDPLEQNSQQGFGWQSAYTNRASPIIQWSVGFDADFSEGELQQTQDEATQGSAFLLETIPTGVHYDYSVSTRQFGTFARVNWSPSERLDVTLDARAERLEYDYVNNALDGNTRDDGTECGFGGCRYSRPADRSDSFSNLSPKLAINYEVNPNSRIHASIASSFRAPQAAELYRLQGGQNVADLDSVRANNIEIGFNYNSESFNFSGTLYKLDQRNVIIRDSDAINVDGLSTSSEGLELSTSIEINSTVSVRSSLTLAKNRYTSEGFSGEENINDNFVDTAPKTLANLGLEWSPIDSWSNELEIIHVGNYYLEPENLREYPGHEVLNFRSQFNYNENLSLNFRLVNITNELYAERADFTTFTDERYFPGAPRTVFAGFRYKFK